MIVLVRSVSPALAGCELTYLDRTPINYQEAQLEHQGYVAALQRLGVGVETVPGGGEHPDSVFVEDTAVVLDSVAIVTRPGSPSRRGETRAIASALSAYRPLLTIEAPGTLDGGDVLQIGRRIFVGESTRSNAHGISQLREHASRHGYTVETIRLRHCLHLKTAVTAIDDDTVLSQPAWIPANAFSGLRVLETDPGEPFAANALRVGEQLIYPDRFPATQAILESTGYSLQTVTLDELAKAEAGPTCCSILLTT